MIEQAEPVRAERIHRIVATAERELPSNCGFHHSALKSAEFELLHLAEHAAQQQKQQQAELDRLRTTIEAWIPRLRALQRCASLEGDRIRSGELDAQFERLESATEPSRLAAAAERLVAEAQEFEEEVREADENDRARQFVLAAVEASLADMGYEVEVLSESSEKTSSQVTSIIALTPDDECVVGTFGLDKSIHFHFQHPVESGATPNQLDQTELAERCQTWCHNHTELLVRLRSLGITATVEREIPPGKVEVPAHVVSGQPKLSRHARRKKRGRPQYRRSGI